MNSIYYFPSIFYMYAIPSWFQLSKSEIIGRFGRETTPSRYRPHTSSVLEEQNSSVTIVTTLFRTQQRKSGRILTTAHIPCERYTMLLLFSCRLLGTLSMSNKKMCYIDVDHNGGASIGMQYHQCLGITLFYTIVVGGKKLK